MSLHEQKLFQFGQPWRGYAFATGITAATISTLFLVGQRTFNIPLIVFIVPIAFSAYLGGGATGFVSTSLSVFAGFYFIKPAHGFALGSPWDYERLITLLATGILISALAERLQLVAAEKKRAGDTLLESEHRYELLFENMVTGFAYCKVLYDAEDRPHDFMYLRVNPAFGQLTGLQNVEGKRVTEVIPEIRESHPELMETYFRVASTGRSETFEIRFNPLEAWFSVTAYSPQKDHFVHVFENITERKAAEQTIRDNEMELAAIYENLPISLLILDEKGRVTKANRHARQFAEGLDVKPGMPFGRWFKCLHALHLANACEPHGENCADCEVRRSVAHTLNTGIGFHELETSLTSRVNGEEQKEIVLLSTARLEVQGKPRVLVTVKDITQRRQTEEQVRAQFQLLKCITEKTTDSVFVVDTEGRTTFLNPEAERVFGISREEAEGELLHDLIHHHRPDGTPYPASECPMLQVLQTGDTVRGYEDIFFRKDGTTLEVSCSNALLEVDGKPVGVVHVMHDITAQKQTARSILRSHKLEALGSVAAGIAHDFNNILAAINGNANLALSDLQPGEPVFECVSQISKAGDRAADLVRRILGFSRPFEQNKRIQPLQPVIEESLKLVRAALPALIEIHVEFAADVPFVNVDSSQIHQIVMNLTTNAAHAIGDQRGRIDVRLDSCWVGSDYMAGSSQIPDGNYARIYVGDTGCGMDPAILDRIFDPFFTTKPTGQGTGLGLSVVHGIVSSHDGHISVYSRPGQGSGFHIYFPAVKGAAVEDQAPKQIIQPLHNERVLYVDDEEALVSLAERKLGRLGYQIKGFTNPRDALQAFRENPDSFDVVVTDLSMPEMSGMDFVRSLLSVRENIPVIVASGYLRPQDEEVARTLGVAELLHKPTPLDELAQALDRVVRERVKSAVKAAGEDS